MHVTVPVTNAAAFAPDAAMTTDDYDSGMTTDEIIGVLATVIILLLAAAIIIIAVAASPPTGAAASAVTSTPMTGSGTPTGYTRSAGLCGTPAQRLPPHRPAGKIPVRRRQDARRRYGAQPLQPCKLRKQLRLRVCFELRVCLRLCRRRPCGLQRQGPFYTVKLPRNSAG